jgi:hypothetical protein
VHALRVEGLREAPRLESVFDPRLTHLADGPQGIAVLDAIDLLVAACDPTQTRLVLQRLGVVDPFVEVDLEIEDGLPIQITFEEGDAGSLLPADGSRTIKVSVDLALDPILFGALREQALRDPRLVGALETATTTLTVGWVFTNDLCTASIGRLSLRIGDVAFPTMGSERPKWMTSWLLDIARRFRRVTDDDLQIVAERVLEASLSENTARRTRAAALCAATGRPPFGLGALELVTLGGAVQPCFGPALTRPRSIGRRGADLVRIAEACVLHQPDVLLIERVDDADSELLAWLRDQTDGDDAILEQVIIGQGNRS